MSGEKYVGRVPRVAAIHDLSCLGRCALTVIMPTLSVMGLQCVPIPTALLSTHTGGFTGMHFLDLSDSMAAVSDHFAALPLTFDAIYSGFLGSERQIGIVSALIDRFRVTDGQRIPVLVDPVMGDDGKLYSTYTPQMQQGMRHLCEKADIITPNLTEACFLTGTPWRDTTDMSAAQAQAFVGDLAERMLAFGATQIVITGVPCGAQIGTYALDVSGGAHRAQFGCVTRHPRSFPGTGDIFASVLLGALLRGEALAHAAHRAAAFVSDVIAFSQDTTEPTRDGVLLEPMLYRLVE